MTLLILGLLIFLGVHSVAMFPELHGRLVSTLGSNMFKGLYSVVSLVGVILLVQGFGAYRADGLIEVWTPPTALKHLNSLFMLISCVALASAYAPLGYIKARFKHPMLVGVKAWAFGHFLANGDLGGMILFGAILAWAVVDRISFKWRPILASEQPAPRVVGDVLAVVIGLIAYGGMIFLHPIVIGLNVMG